ncbi:MAG: hypothetical protein KIT24_00080 [Phycisphaeraceae bacterium]|nr:hypothetical protein [Phycisphaeraceae bacterium]
MENEQPGSMFWVVTCNPYPDGVKELTACVEEHLGQAPRHEQTTIGYGGPNDILQFVTGAVGWEQVLKAVLTAFGISYGTMFGAELARHHARLLSRPDFWNRLAQTPVPLIKSIANVVRKLLARDPDTSFWIGLPVGDRSRNACLHINDADEAAIGRAVVCLATRAFTIESILLGQPFRGQNAAIHLPLDAGNGIDYQMRLLEDGRIELMCEVVYSSDRRSGSCCLVI